MIGWQEQVSGKEDRDTLISWVFGTTLFSVLDQNLRNLSKFEQGENLEKRKRINSFFFSNNRKKDCVRRKPVCPPTETDT